MLKHELLFLNVTVFRISDAFLKNYLFVKISFCKLNNEATHDAYLVFRNCVQEAAPARIAVITKFRFPPCIMHCIYVVNMQYLGS